MEFLRWFLLLREAKPILAMLIRTSVRLCDLVLLLAQWQALTVICGYKAINLCLLPTSVFASCVVRLLSVSLLYPRLMDGTSISAARTSKRLKLMLYENALQSYTRSPSSVRRLEVAR